MRGANRRESMANSRRSGPTQVGSILQMPNSFHLNSIAQMQNQANKRGIIKCQLWPIKKDILSWGAPTCKRNQYKIQYQLLQENYEYYCPRCDMYFKTRDEYMEHLVIKSYKSPFVAKLRDFHGQANNAKYSLDFDDERDKTKFHTAQNERRYYNLDEVINEVIDLRDRARVLRKKRQKTRTYAKSEFHYDLPLQQKRHVSTGRTPSQLFVQMQLAQKKLISKFNK